MSLVISRRVDDSQLPKRDVLSVLVFMAECTSADWFDNGFQEGWSLTEHLVRSPALAKLRILIVDDNADDRELLALMIEQEGGEAILATSASEALDWMQRTKINVLISDICMPGEDGYSLIRKIRALPTSHQVPAIAFSSSLSETYREQALAAGFQKYLLKPVDLNELVDTITELVNKFD